MEFPFFKQKIHQTEPSVTACPWRKPTTEALRSASVRPTPLNSCVLSCWQADIVRQAQDFRADVLQTQN